MSTRTFWSGLLIIPAVLSVAACATQTALETAWTLPGYQEQPFDTIVVVATMRDSTEGNAFESAAVAEFAKVGVDAVPGFSFLKDETNLDKKELEKRVRATGAQGALFFKEIAVDGSNDYLPPTNFYFDGAFDPDWWDDPFWGYYHPYPFGYWGYWYPAVQVVSSPAYWRTYSTYRIESTLYRVSDDKLIWTATSDTYGPSNEGDLGASVTNEVIENLRAHDLVK